MLQAQIDAMDEAHVMAFELGLTQGAGGVWKGTCPFCGGRMRYVYNGVSAGGRGFCDYCELHHLDGVGLYARLKGVTVGAAVKALGGFVSMTAGDFNGHGQRTDNKTDTDERPEKQAAIDWEKWRAAASSMLRYSVKQMEATPRAQDWLFEKYGFGADIRRKYSLGFLPLNTVLTYENWGIKDGGTLTVQHGEGAIVIPMFDTGTDTGTDTAQTPPKSLSRILLRNMTMFKGYRYTDLAGSHGAFYLQGAPSYALAVCEGWADAIALKELCPWLSVLAVLGVRCLKSYADLYAAAGKRILWASDADVKGDGMSRDGVKLYGGERLRPSEKDWAETYRTHDKNLLQNNIKAAVDRL